MRSASGTSIHSAPAAVSALPWSCPQARSMWEHSPMGDRSPSTPLLPTKAGRFQSHCHRRAVQRQSTRSCQLPDTADRLRYSGHLAPATARTISGKITVKDAGLDQGIMLITHGGTLVDTLDLSDKVKVVIILTPPATCLAEQPLHRCPAPSMTCSSSAGAQLSRITPPKPEAQPAST